MDLDPVAADCFRVSYTCVMAKIYVSRGVDRNVSALPGNPLIGGRVR